MRNILAYVLQKEKEKVAAKLKLIWKAPDEKTARTMKDDFCEEYEKSFPKVEEGFEDSVLRLCGAGQPQDFKHQHA